MFEIALPVKLSNIILLFYKGPHHISIIRDVLIEKLLFKHGCVSKWRKEKVFLTIHAKVWQINVD